MLKTLFWRQNTKRQIHCVRLITYFQKISINNCISDGKYNEINKLLKLNDESTNYFIKHRIHGELITCSKKIKQRQNELDELTPSKWIDGIMCGCGIAFSTLFITYDVVPGACIFGIYTLWKGVLVVHNNNQINDIEPELAKLRKDHDELTNIYKNI
jgi:hypothetical protein